MLHRVEEEIAFKASYNLLRIAESLSLSLLAHPKLLSISIIAILESHEHDFLVDGTTCARFTDQPQVKLHEYLAASFEPHLVTKQ